MLRSKTAPEPTKVLPSLDNQENLWIEFCCTTQGAYKPSKDWCFLHIPNYYVCKVVLREWDQEGLGFFPFPVSEGEKALRSSYHTLGTSICSEFYFPVSNSQPPINMAFAKKDQNGWDTSRNSWFGTWFIFTALADVYVQVWPNCQVCWEPVSCFLDWGTQLWKLGRGFWAGYQLTPTFVLKCLVPVSCLKLSPGAKSIK